jgi:outer membrane protein W
MFRRFSSGIRAERFSGLRDPRVHVSSEISLMNRRIPFVSYLAGVLISASIVSSQALAQGSPIGKGSWIISGGASASSQHNNGTDQSTTSLSLAPSALYFVRPGLALGGAVSLGYFDGSIGTTKSFGIGPSIRYYFGDAAAKTFPFVSATIAPAWLWTDPKNSSTARSTSQHSLEAEGTIGLTHLVATHVGITGEAFYQHQSFDTDIGTVHATQSSYAFGVRFGITAFVF